MLIRRSGHRSWWLERVPRSETQSSPSLAASASTSISTSQPGASLTKLSSVVVRHTPRGCAASRQGALRYGTMKVTLDEKCQPFSVRSPARLPRRSASMPGSPKTHTAREFHLCVREHGHATSESHSSSSPFELSKPRSRSKNKLLHTSRINPPLSTSNRRHDVYAKWPNDADRLSYIGSV
jgi:hypothetical protein